CISRGPCVFGTSTETCLPPEPQRTPGERPPHETRKSRGPHPVLEGTGRDRRRRRGLPPRGPQGPRGPRVWEDSDAHLEGGGDRGIAAEAGPDGRVPDRKSTRLNSSH